MNLHNGHKAFGEEAYRPNTKSQTDQTNRIHLAPASINGSIFPLIKGGRGVVIHSGIIF